MSELVKVGTVIKSRYSDDVMQIVANDYRGRIPEYEAKWINNGELSAGSLFIVGSQIFDYEIIEEPVKTISLADDFHNMDSAIAGFFSSIYK